MPQLGWTARPDGHIDYYNRRWYAYTGATFEDMQGWGWKSVHDPDHLPAVLERWNRSLETGEPFEMEFRLRRHDGEMRWFLTRVEPMRNEQGQIVRWVGINTDIHQQKRAQRVLERSREADAAERERYARLFEQAPLPIAVFEGPEHRYALVNPSARELIDGRELVGLPFREAHPEPEARPLAEILDRVYETGVGFRQDEAQPVLIVDADGSPRERHIRIAWEPLLGPDGEVAGIMSIGVELTEQMRLQRELRASEQRANRANRAKDRFLAMLGHELRNPLAPIRTALELMSLELELESARRERDMIERQVAHLVSMVDDLLDVARVSRGKLSLELRVVDLADVVAAAVETAGPALENKRHDLSVDVPRGRFAVRGDRPRLAQIVANLLINAAKYTPEGGRVEVDATAVEDHVELAVRDDGDGLSAELLGRVFEPFEQSEQTIERADGGLGLGLAIARELAELHGGTLDAASAGEGLGSVFTVRLPLRDLRELRPTPPEPAQLADAPVVPRRILLVDDNVDAAEALAMRLIRQGYDVTAAYDGAEALAVAPHVAPDVCVLDIGLPLIDGYELAARLRERLDPAPRLLALTGYGQVSDKQRRGGRLRASLHQARPHRRAHRRPRGATAAPVVAPTARRGDRRRSARTGRVSGVRSTTGVRGRRRSRASSAADGRAAPRASGRRRPPGRDATASAAPSARPRRPTADRRAARGARSRARWRARTRWRGRTPR